MKQYILEVADDGTPTVKGLFVPPKVRPKALGLRGVNLTGGDCPWNGWKAQGAPVNGRNYKFVSNDLVKQMIDAGCNYFRLVFTWEALANYPSAPWTVSWGSPYASELSRVVRAIRDGGAGILLDLHGGTAGVWQDSYSPSSLGAFWEEVLLNYNFSGVSTGLNYNFSGVSTGITNEPHNTPSTWLNDLQKLLLGSDFYPQKTMFPAPNWSAASTWVSSGEADRYVALFAKRPTVQLHLYLDKDASGSTSDVVSPTIGVERVREATEHARKNGYKLFLGEVGVPNTDGCPAWDNLHEYMLDNADVWTGFTAWATGPSDWWGANRFYCGPGSKSLANMKKALVGA